MALKQRVSHYPKEKNSETLKGGREKSVWASPVPWEATLAYQQGMGMGWGVWSFLWKGIWQN